MKTSETTKKSPTKLKSFPKIHSSIVNVKATRSKAKKVSARSFHIDLNQVSLPKATDFQGAKAQLGNKLGTKLFSPNKLAVPKPRGN